MILIDTNLLVYGTVPGFDEHGQALRVLHRIQQEDAPHCLTWLNVFEYLRVVTHPKMVLPEPLPIDEALENVQSLLAHPHIFRLDPGPEHLSIFQEICREVGNVRGNFVYDCRIAALMREHDVSQILTRDRDFARIPRIQVLDPFASSPP